MTAPRPVEQPTGRRPALVEQLMGAVRGEFRAEVLVFAATDPVFGGGACRVAGCDRSARGHRLCQGHHLRWAKQHRPDLAVFAATTDPGWCRQRPNGVCRVPGCGYGVCRGGLCQLHHQRWDRSGRPDLDRWLADAPVVKQPPAGVTCRVGHCALWPQGASPLCHAHAHTWKANGRPDIDAFVDGFAAAQVTEDDIIRLDRLGPQLRLELQYMLQCRHDERTTKTMPAVVMRVVRFLATTTTTSLLDQTEAVWAGHRDQPAPKDPTARALLVYARRRVEDLADADGWEGEYPRDVWQLRRLGFHGNQTLRFQAITQPWLRSLVKRWLRWRLGTGIGLEAARRGLLSLTRFARFCEAIDVPSLADVDRMVLERYLGDLHANIGGRQSHGDQIGQLNSFLHAVRQHGWDDTLPATALLFPDDYPTRTERPPRALTEQVMAQIEHPDNLDQWTNPAYRLVTLILIRCGLRVSDALRLPHDCIVSDADQSALPALLQPQDEATGAGPNRRTGACADRRSAVPGHGPRPVGLNGPVPPVPKEPRRSRPHQQRHLPALRSTDGSSTATSATSTDAPIHLTPHQWRHTLGTRLINRDVPQEVVRRILDHDSPQMTAHYARLHDTTVRRHWEAARKVNIDGNNVIVDPDGPLAEAAWAKQRLGRATQALPNGFCGLPVQQTCPHANACLTCPMFMTTADFLPQHHSHREQVVQIITAAEARGQTRLQEMNHQVLTNLDKIITTLTDDPQHSDEVADAC